MATKKSSSPKNVSARPVVIAPRITEKAARLSEGNAYTFNVAVDATKLEIKRAIEVLYKKSPIKVAVSNKGKEYVFRRGRLGTKNAYKKAVVYLKRGETIDFI